MTELLKSDRQSLLVEVVKNRQLLLQFELGQNGSRFQHSLEKVQAAKTKYSMYQILDIFFRKATKHTYNNIRSGFVLDLERKPDWKIL